ncbi:UNVERIFIED_CONTAM: hypothetical protein K2H54_013727 [Gekko kuhli]
MGLLAAYALLAHIIPDVSIDAIDDALTTVGLGPKTTPISGTPAQLMDVLLLPAPVSPSRSTGSDSGTNASERPKSPAEPSPNPAVLDNLPISPSKDLSSYGDLVKQMAHLLGLSIVHPQPSILDAVFDVVQLDTSTSITLLMGSLGKNPSSVPVSSRCLDHRYRVQEMDTEFLHVHPKPDSMVVSSSLKSKNTLATPSDKEGKKLDLMG